jgi:creatinine amidohydrolase
LILNTGISTVAPIDNAIADVTAPARVRHLKLHDGPHYLGAVARLREQLRGSHADEIETS